MKYIKSHEYGEIKTWCIFASHLAGAKYSASTLQSLWLINRTSKEPHRARGMVAMKAGGFCACLSVYMRALHKLAKGTLNIQLVYTYTYNVDQYIKCDALLPL